MPRLSDDDYYIDNRTEHVAQGDIFRNVPLRWVSAASEEPVGLDTYGMLITYTSGMMQQPPGARDYKHSFRLIAPVLPFALLAQMGVPETALNQVRTVDNLASFMYLPPYPDEFEESAVLPYRACLVEREVIEENRVTQLQRPAAVQLQLKLATTFLGGKWDPRDFDPDLSDHWNI